jgi:hypothetical protein
MILFAARENVQEFLGFRPNDLVYGYTVRGPLKMLKEKFLSEDNSSLDLLKYVSDLRERLSTACEVARQNLKVTQTKIKLRYDEKY